MAAEDVLMNKLIFILFLTFLGSCATADNFIDYTQASALPDFELKIMNRSPGEKLSSDALVGKTIIIEFYFESCPACNQNHANYSRLYDEFSSNPNFVFLEVGVDCSEYQYDAWVTRHSPKARILNDCPNKLHKPMGVSLYPTFTIIKPDRNEAIRTTGVWSGSNYQRIAQYLKEHP